MGNKERCLSFNKDILEKDPTVYAAWENLGYYYLSLGDTNTSKTHFLKAIQYGLRDNELPISLK